MNRRLYSNWLTRRIGMWLLMLIIGALYRRLTGQPKGATSRKAVKNKAK